MAWDIFKQFNWVDVFAVILFFRVVYVALKNGLAIEFFKFLGTLAAIYLSLHYYTHLSDWVRQRLVFAKENVPLEFLDFVCFLILAIVGYLVFVLLRSIFNRFIKMEAVPNLNKWAGFLLGLARGYLFLGLVIFSLVISSIPYFKNSVQKSYSGKYLFKVAADTYASLWEGLVSKFMPQDKFNQTIREVQENFTRK